MELGRVEEALELAERSRARAFLDLLGQRERSADASATVAPSTLLGDSREARRRETTLVEYFSRTSGSSWSRRARGRDPGGIGSGLAARAVPAGAARPGRPRGGSRGSAAAAPRPDRPVSASLPADPGRLVTIIPHGPLFLVSFAALFVTTGRISSTATPCRTAPPSVCCVSPRRRARGRGNPSDCSSSATRRCRRRARETAPFGASPARTPRPGRSVALSRGPRDRADGARGGQADLPRWPEASPSSISPRTPCSSTTSPCRASWRSRPRRGSVAARPDPEEDGRLTVREVFELDLSASLVTLSACNTGLGLVNGDGVLGLSRAFLYAGTPSVLVSLWRVADSVTRFQMERFYRALIATGGDKAAAIRPAELETIRALRSERLRAPSGRPLREAPVSGRRSSSSAKRGDGIASGRGRVGADRIAA